MFIEYEFESETVSSKYAGLSKKWKEILFFFPLKKILPEPAAIKKGQTGPGNQTLWWISYRPFTGPLLSSLMQNCRVSFLKNFISAVFTEQKSTSSVGEGYTIFILGHISQCKMSTNHMYTNV